MFRIPCHALPSLVVIFHFISLWEGRYIYSFSNDSREILKRSRAVTFREMRSGSSGEDWLSTIRNFTTFLLRSNINIFGGNNVSLIRWYLITKFIKVQFEMEKYRIIKNFLKNIYLSIKNSFAPFNYIQIFFYLYLPLIIP